MVRPVWLFPPPAADGRTMCLSAWTAGDSPMFAATRLFPRPPSPPAAKIGTVPCERLPVQEILAALYRCSPMVQNPTRSGFILIVSPRQVKKHPFLVLAALPTSHVSILAPRPLYSVQSSPLVPRRPSTPFVTYIYLSISITDKRIAAERRIKLLPYGRMWSCNCSARKGN